MTYYKATRMDGTDFRTGKIDYTKVPLPEMSGTGKFPGAGWLHLATTPSECVGAEWPCRLFEIEPASDAQTYIDGSHPHKIGTSKAYVTREIESWRFFGPQGKEVVALINRAKTLSPDEINKVSAVHSAARSAAISAAYSAVHSAARSAAYSAARWTAIMASDSAARSAAYSATDSAVHSAARSAAISAARWASDSAAIMAAYSAAYSAARWTAIMASDSAADSAQALTVRDKISKEHYDALTIPWRTAIGPIHPDDIDVRKPNFDQEINQVQDALNNLKSAIKKGSS